MSLRVLDYAGKTVREMRGPDTPGLHKVPWNLTRFASGMVGPGTYRCDVVRQRAPERRAFTPREPMATYGDPLEVGEAALGVEDAGYVDSWRSPA